MENAGLLGSPYAGDVQENMEYDENSGRGGGIKEKFCCKERDGPAPHNIA